MEKKFNTFSVPLGLLDYVNPILYTVTMVTIIKHLSSEIASPFHKILLIGAIISIFFGFIIPTGKVIVGLGIIEFVMPVSLVFCVNSGILLSGLVLFCHVMKLPTFVFWTMGALVILSLALLYIKHKKMNTIAVLIGAVGYLLTYISLITLSIQKGMRVPIILYAVAILLFVMLVGIGIKGNLKNPKVHWVIEISNVNCQLLVSAATVMLFLK